MRKIHGILLPFKICGFRDPAAVLMNHTKLPP